MTRDEQSSAEFKILNDEIAENSRKTYQIIVACYTLSAAIIGYCFSPNHFPLHWGQPFALLSPFAILIPAILLIEANQKSTIRIATYLQIAFDELPPNTEMNAGWQSAVQWCRCCTDKVTRSRFSRNSTPSIVKLWQAYKDNQPRGTRSFSRSLGSLLWIIALISIASSIGTAAYWILRHDWLENEVSCPIKIFEAVAYVVSVVACVYLFAWKNFLLWEAWNEERFEEWLRHWRVKWFELDPEPVSTRPRRRRTATPSEISGRNY